MINRIEVKTIVFDSRAAQRKQKFSYFSFYKKIKDVFLLDVYTVDKKLSLADLKRIGAAVSNPVTQNFSLSPEKKKFDWAIEIGFLPGVTDNISHTVRQIGEDLLGIKFENGEDVYSSQITFITGNLNQKQINEIAASLYNPLIQRVNIKNYRQFLNDSGMDRTAPIVNLSKKQKVSEVDLEVDDEELIKIGKFGIANDDGTRRGPLALDLDYLQTIRTYFRRKKRKPTDIELESLAQTWSEHCKHTIFRDPVDKIKTGLFNHYIKGATEVIRRKKSAKGRSPSGRDFCVSVFSDNSGAISFDKNYLITHKVETHNSPSALDPFGGAVTGIVGVNRDTLGFGLGAKPIANCYGFCLADPRIDQPLYKGINFSQPMLSSKRIMNGVIDGVNAGGNQSGIPTPQGFLNFDERFRGKPLVFVGTIGLIPKKIQGKPSHLKKARPDDYVVVIGGRVGKDGIHGATFSSEVMDSTSPATAVQIGDPITQKKLSDVIVKEARDKLLYNSITDNGAGGLSCSVAEMAKESGGVAIDLETVPLKYPGLDPWEIWISESQERMTLAVPKKNWKKFKTLMDSREVEAVRIGTFNNSGQCLVRYNGKTIMDIDMDFLHDGLPKRFLKTTYSQPKHREPVIAKKKNLGPAILAMLSRLNITGYSFISQQYDYVVLGNSVLPPLQGRGRVNSDASAIRPILESQKGVILSQALYPSYGDIDSYHMTAAAIDTAVRNAVAAGADPNYLVILDNFCWCSADDPERLGQLKRAAQACYDYAVAFGTPFISGKDSMFNDFKGFDEKGRPIKISIPPTLLISSIGVVNDITKVVSLDVKQSGDLIYLLGETRDELGGSEYFAMNKAVGNQVPKVDAGKNLRLYNKFFEAVEKRLMASSISVGRGGLAVALAKTSIAGKLGLEISLRNLPGKFSREDYALFSESQGRILATVDPKNKNSFEKIMKGSPIKLIGAVTEKPQIIIKGLNNEMIVELNLDQAERSYKKTFKDY